MAEFLKQPLNMDWFTRQAEWITQNPKTATSQHCFLCMAFSEWDDVQRPFFNVHPAVLKCLQNTKMEIDLAQIPQSILHRLKLMEVRVPKGYGFVPFYMRIGPEFGNGTQDTKLTLLSATDAGDDKMHTWWMVQPFGQPCGFDSIAEDAPPKDIETQAIASLRVAIGVMLLAADPRFCQPILLNRDKGKLLSESEREVAIQRAAKRGQFGFDIGKDIELSPHFRRPHFAIRWTGKGGEVPKLVPVKGCVINEKLMTSVPTGYDGPEELEAGCLQLS